MLRHSPNHGTLRLPNDDDDEMRPMSNVKFLSTLFPSFPRIIARDANSHLSTSTLAAVTAGGGGATVQQIHRAA